MTTISKLGLALTLALTGTSFSALANDEGGKKINGKPIVVFGYAFGGDDMGELEYEDGSSSSVSAGGGFTIGGGFDFDIDTSALEFDKKIGVQLTGAYKFDSATADNADITMDRFEFTVLPYVAINEKVSLGAGVSFHTGVEFSAEMDGSSSDSLEYDAATAFVAQLLYKQSEQFQWGARFTSVSYTPSSINGQDLSNFDIEDTGASNFGIFGSFSFK